MTIIPALVVVSWLAADPPEAAATPPAPPAAAAPAPAAVPAPAPAPAPAKKGNYLRLAAPVFYRDYAYVARFTAPGGALVTVVASERVTGLRGIGPIVTGADLPDELASAARGDGFEALYQITGQQGADLSDRLVLARARE